MRHKQMNGSFNFIIITPDMSKNTSFEAAPLSTNARSTSKVPVSVSPQSRRFK